MSLCTVYCTVFSREGVSRVLAAWGYMTRAAKKPVGHFLVHSWTTKVYYIQMEVKERMIKKERNRKRVRGI